MIALEGKKLTKRPASQVEHGTGRATFFFFAPLFSPIFFPKTFTFNPLSFDERCDIGAHLASALRWLRSFLRVGIKTLYFWVSQLIRALSFKISL